MELSYASYRDYDTFSLKGVLNISAIVSVTSQLSRHVQENPGKDLVLDFSSVSSVDSSGLRLLVNLCKRVESYKAHLYVLAPNEAIFALLETTNLNQAITVVGSLDQLDSKQETDLIESFRRYAKPGKGFPRLICSCPVCGSPEVAGYLVDQNVYPWRWEGTSPFPLSYPEGTSEPEEVLGHQPIVCTECCMASIDIRDFNMVEAEQVTRRSTMGDQAKAVLAKSMKKRRKMIETGGMVDDKHFYYPRSRRAMYHACLLAEFCVRSLATDRKRVRPFTIAYLNFLAFRFADEASKMGHVNTCRTWLTQSLNERQDLTPAETAIAFFIMLVADLNLGKPREATQAYRAFCELMESQPPDTGTAAIASPHFWFAQAERIWHEEIEEKSRELRIEQ